jgi:hypothetical protein
MVVFTLSVVIKRDPLAPINLLVQEVFSMLGRGWLQPSFLAMKLDSSQGFQSSFLTVLATSPNFYF